MNYTLANASLLMILVELTSEFRYSSTGVSAVPFHEMVESLRLGSIAWLKALITRPFKSEQPSLTSVDVPRPALADSATRRASHPLPIPKLKTRATLLALRAAAMTASGSPTCPSVSKKIRFFLASAF